MKGPINPLRNGFSSLETEHNSCHQVDLLERSRDTTEWDMKMNMVRRTYGSGLAMRLATEKASLNKSRRLPGLHFSTVAFDILKGSDNSIDFSDFLNGK